jgi:hypothetical protein
MINKMGAEKLPIFCLDVLAAAVAYCHSAPYTCMLVVNGGKDTGGGILKIQGVSFITTLSTASLLCRQPASTGTSCHSNSNHKGEKLYYIQFYIILHFILQIFYLFFFVCTYLLEMFIVEVRMDSLFVMDCDCLLLL